MHPAWIAGFQGSARTGAFPRNKAQTPLPQITRRSQQCNLRSLAVRPCSAMCTALRRMCAGCDVERVRVSRPDGNDARKLACAPRVAVFGHVAPMLCVSCLGHSCAPWRLPAPPCGPGCLPCAAGGVLLRRTIRVFGDGCNPRFWMIMELGPSVQVRALKIFSPRGVDRG